MNRRQLCAGLAASPLVSRLYARDHAARINVGLELYSLREQMQHDVAGTLALVRRMGFDHVEVPALYGLSPTAFRHALDQAGLKATAMVFPYEDLRDKVADVKRTLDILRARWALLGWIPHGKTFERADAERSARDMNSWSRALHLSGHPFAYHLHGYEFQPAPEGTLFDVLAGAANPETVQFELDTFWIIWPGQDCVQLMRRYPGRFRLLHLKDLRKGVKTGDLSGMAPLVDSVAVGEGVVPWQEVLAEAKAQQFEDYFIEDESPNALQQIPLSLRYLSRTGAM